MTAATVLVDLLVTEHAAIYAYGVIGAHLSDHDQPQAQAAYDAHRRSRDALTALLTSLKLSVPGPLASYAVSVPTPLSAMRLAVAIETDLGVRWRDLIGSTDELSLRTLGTRSLTDCTVRAALWRVTAGIHPVTDPLPGTPS